MSDQPRSQIRYRMGTLFEIRIWSGDGPEDRRAVSEAFAEIARLERGLSRFDETSELNRMAAQAARRPVPVSQALFRVLKLARVISEATGGAFDVTGRPGGWRALRLDPTRRTVLLERADLRFDLGGIGKGEAVDRAVDLLQSRGIRRGWVDAGGNFRVFGFPERRQIGIEDPMDPGRLCGTAPLTKPAVASSANRTGHILDGRTGQPADGKRGATVMADSAVLADALSTALLILGAEGGPLLNRFGARGFLVTRQAALSTPQGQQNEEIRAWT